MSEQIREQMSALLDGELPVAEQRLLLERLGRDAGLRARLSRYQLISDAAHQTLPPHVDLALVDRVMTALDEQPAYRPPAAWAARAAKPLVGLAVAASVAVVAVLAVQQVRAPGPGAPVLQVATNPPVSAVVLPGGGDAQLAGASQPGNERLNEYLVNHSEYAASGGLPGISPYARIVGYEQE